MAYTEPTADDFKARFPSLADIGDDLIGLVLAEAIGTVGDTWLERDRATAQLYYAAHIAASEGLANGGASAVAGPVKRDKVGDVETEYAGLGGSADAMGGFGSTVYGRGYARLLRLNFPGVAVA